MKSGAGVHLTLCVGLYLSVSLPLFLWGLRERVAVISPDAGSVKFEARLKTSTASDPTFSHGDEEGAGRS